MAKAGLLRAGLVNTNAILQMHFIIVIKPLPVADVEEQKPFYQQWWFLVIVALVGVIIIITVVLLLCLTGRKRRKNKYKGQ